MKATEAHRPATVWIATCISLIAFAIGQYSMHARTAQAMSMMPPVLVVAVFVFSFALLATILYFVFQGYNWARITLLAVVSLRAFSMLSRLLHGAPHINASIEITRVSLEVFSLCLLFAPPSNRWFKQRQKQA